MRKDIETQINEMEEMKLPELQARFAEVVGEETKAPNKKYLIKRIVEVLERETEQTDGAKEQNDFQPIEPENEMPEDDESHDDEENDEYVEEENKGEEEESPKTETETNDNLPRKERSLSRLDVDELRDLYVETVGRPTGSMDKRYLIWKITQARKGKITVGPIPNRRSNGALRDYKVLPLRMETDLVEKIDEAWKRQGLESRMQLFRRALSAYLADNGENELAILLIS